MPRKKSEYTTDDETQLRELAAILARGVLRLRQQSRRTATTAAPATKSGRESSSPGLEVPAKTVLSVSTRVNAPESLKPRSTTC